ncbi:unnamed protein product [Sphagnum tenellum]
MEGGDLSKYVADRGMLQHLDARRLFTQMDSRVSGFHCKVMRSNDGTASVFDSSANGVRINGVLVGRNASMRIADGDCLELVASVAGMPGRVDNQSPVGKFADHLKGISYVFFDALRSSVKRSHGLEEIDGQTPRKQVGNSCRHCFIFNPLQPGCFQLFRQPRVDKPGMYLKHLPDTSASRLSRVKVPIMLIGRRPDCDLMLDSQAVSSVHCKLITTGNGVCTIDDCSRNGVLVNGVKVSGETPLSSGDVITIVQGVGVTFALSIVLLITLF